ncbi:MAG TPA: hypothetical protein PL029_00980 [Bacteroidia bacterium]|nr:hypothetical protein [Bacteroidia bacterium]
MKVKKINKRAAVIYNQKDLLLLLDNYGSGGKLDAFRHAFFMAAFATQIKIKKLRKLGMAHEKGNYRQFLRSATEEGEIPDSLASVMDLQNNELGFVIGSANKDSSLVSIKTLVLQDIIAGKALIMKRNKRGEYLNCDNVPLKKTSLEKKWSLPKCLVASDYPYAD